MVSLSRLFRYLITGSRIGALQPHMLETIWFGLIPVRSPLLGESLLISFPPGTEMFHFPGLALTDLCIQPEVIRCYPDRVPPFGNPRVKACLTAHRGLSQPSTSFFAS
jgi:hypothetical protein